MDNITMTNGQPLKTVARQVSELLLFGLGLLVALWASQDISFSAWQALLVLGALYCAIGAVPCAWERRASLVAIAAFLTPLAILGYIEWRMEYFFIFERSGAWPNLPRVLFGPENLAVASGLCGCAILGLSLGRKVAASARRRTTG